MEFPEDRPVISTGRLESTRSQLKRHKSKLHYTKIGTDTSAERKTQSCRTIENSEELMPRQSYCLC